MVVYTVPVYLNCTYFVSPCVRFPACTLNLMAETVLLSVGLFLSHISGTLKGQQYMSTLKLFGLSLTVINFIIFMFNTVV